MWQSAKLHFASDHPTAAGHFPSNPIVPGALMLDEVVAAITGDAHDGAVLIRATKFLQPVRHGAQINLQWQSLATGAIQFECRLAGEENLAMTGTIEIGPMP
jgi:3-hydroxymyristoyl/3-hydroxydecanoyl-(acyl carrier protein) dehydratase